MSKTTILSGIVMTMLSVIFGAFGAHYLKSIFTSELLNSFETGVKYQMYHGIALIVLGIYARWSNSSVKKITALFVLGILLFSGSIYVLCFLKSNMQIGLGGLGILTPLGGLLLIAAWILWFMHALKLPSKEG